jgi:hypothetical protein
MKFVPTTPTAKQAPAMTAAIRSGERGKDCLIISFSLVHIRLAAAAATGHLPNVE